MPGEWWGCSQRTASQWPGQYQWWFSKCIPKELSWRWKSFQSGKERHREYLEDLPILSRNMQKKFSSPVVLWVGRTETGFTVPCVRGVPYSSMEETLFPFVHPYTEADFSFPTQGMTQAMGPEKQWFPWDHPSSFPLSCPEFWQNNRSFAGGSGRKEC